MLALSQLIDGVLRYLRFSTVNKPVEAKGNSPVEEGHRNCLRDRPQTKEAIKTQRDDGENRGNAETSEHDTFLLQGDQIRTFVPRHEHYVNSPFSTLFIL